MIEVIINVVGVVGVVGCVFSFLGIFFADEAGFRFLAFLFLLLCLSVVRVAGVAMGASDCALPSEPAVEVPQ